MNNKDLHYYYGNYKVEYSYLKYLKNREFVMLPAKVINANPQAKKRMMRVHNIQSFRFWMDAMHSFDGDRIFNMYYSLASFRDGIPKTDPTKIYEKDSIDFSEFNENAYKYMDGYDFLLDIDAGGFDEMQLAAESMQNISMQFDLLNCPYQLRFSGKGFHFIIPYSYFKYLNLSFNPNDEVNIYQIMLDIAIYFYDNVTEMADINIYDSRRVVKLPYSWSLYDEGAFMCRPMNQAELNVFKLEQFKYYDDNYMEEDKIYNENGDISKLLRVVTNGKKNNPS